MNFEISIVNPYKNRLLQNKIEFSAKNVANRDTNIFLQKFDLNEDNYNEYYDENINISPLVEQIEKNTSSDAFIICCYEDSGLDFLRTLTPKTVMGVGESAFHMANLISKNFSVITPLSRSNEAIKNNLIKYGLYNKCISINSFEVPVIDLETMSNSNLLKLKNEIERIKIEDNAEAIIICGLGITKLSKKLELEFNIPIIDGISASVTLTETLLKMGLKINKLGLNNTNRYMGNLSEFS